MSPVAFALLAVGMVVAWCIAAAVLALLVGGAVRLAEDDGPQD